MNARQKAKHYKKLYEKSKVPVHTILFTESTLRHYTVRDAFDDHMMEAINRYSDDMTDWMIKKHAYNLARHIEQMLPRFMETDENNQVSRFDFWIKEKEEE